MSVVAWVLLLAAQNPPVDDQESPKEVRAARALGWLEDGDPELRKIARKTLLSMGRDAIPFLEQILEARGVGEMVKILREIKEGYGSPMDLELDVKLPKNAPKVEDRVVDRYVRARYYEALAHARAGRYQRGHEMANALAVLEPKAPIVDTVKKLRRYCNHMITQTTLVEAKVVQGKTLYAEGEPIELMLRMRNLYKSQMEFTWDEGKEGSPGYGQAIVEIEIRIPELDGTQVVDRRSDTVRFERKVPIATGAQWEKSFPLNVKPAVESLDQIVLVTVHAWCYPLKIGADGRDLTRRIQFHPAVLKIVPKKYMKHAADPLGGLRAAMSTGIVQEVFITAMMLEGDQRKEGIRLLIETLGKAETAKGRYAIGGILTSITGEKHGTDWKKWDAWRREQDGTSR